MERIDLKTLQNIIDRIERFTTTCHANGIERTTSDLAILESEIDIYKESHKIRKIRDGLVEGRHKTYCHSCDLSDTCAELVDIGFDNLCSTMYGILSEKIRLVEKERVGI